MKKIAKKSRILAVLVLGNAGVLGFGGCAPMNSADPSSAASDQIEDHTGDTAGVSLSQSGNHVVWATFQGEKDGKVAAGPVLTVSFKYLSYPAAAGAQTPVVMPSSAASFYVEYEKLAGTHMSDKIAVTIGADGTYQAPISFRRPGVYDVYIHCVEGSVDDVNVIQIEATS